MINIRKPIFLLAFITINLLFNVSFANQGLQVAAQDGYVRETIPGTSISSAYMTLNNSTNKNRRLTSASSSVSKRIEIHEHIMKDGMMRMRQRDSVEILANDSTVFQPSGYHLMIFDLKQPLKAGETIIITLHFDDESSLDVNYQVKGLKQKQHHHH